MDIRLNKIILFVTTLMSTTCTGYNYNEEQKQQQQFYNIQKFTANDNIQIHQDDQQQYKNNYFLTNPDYRQIIKNSENIFENKVKQSSFIPLQFKNGNNFGYENTTSTDDVSSMLKITTPKTTSSYSYVLSSESIPTKDNQNKIQYSSSYGQNINLPSTSITDKKEFYLSPPIQNYYLTGREASTYFNKNLLNQQNLNGFYHNEEFLTTTTTTTPYTTKISNTGFNFNPHPFEQKNPMEMDYKTLKSHNNHNYFNGYSDASNIDNNEHKASSLSNYWNENQYLNIDSNKKQLSNEQISENLLNEYLEFIKRQLEENKQIEEGVQYRNYGGNNGLHSYNHSINLTNSPDDTENTKALEQTRNIIDQQTKMLDEIKKRKRENFESSDNGGNGGTGKLSDQHYSNLYDSFAGQINSNTNLEQENIYNSNNNIDPSHQNSFPKETSFTYYQPKDINLDVSSTSASPNYLPNHITSHSSHPQHTHHSFVINSAHQHKRFLPLHKHVDLQVIKHFPVPIYKKIHIPTKHNVQIQIPQPILMSIPKPVPIQVPVTKTIAVPIVKEIKLPIEKFVPVPVEKRIPYPVEKPVPYHVEKHLRVPIYQPYPVKVPMIKTVLHNSHTFHPRIKYGLYYK